MKNPVPESSDRPLALRVRPELEYLELGAGESRYWRVKDPLTARFFELGPEEFHVLERLDGRTSLAELQADCERRFAPLRLSRTHLAAFLGRLHREGLVIADASGQGEQLLRRDTQRRRQAWLWNWTRLLAMRWRGIDPDRLLARIEPWCGWLFSPPAVAAALLLVAAAVVLLLTHAEAVRLRVPEFQAFFSLRNAPWLLLSVGAAKIWHELAHGLACRRFGGQCHQLGLMLLAFIPCLYCDVSDAWMFRSRWRRAAVGAAGVYAELLLAAVCTFVWWFSEPGWVNSIAFNLMVVSSVNTLLFNANPLLRYDGYYVLSDLAEIPNLQDRAAAVVRRALAWCFLRTDPPADRLSGEPRPLALGFYGLASLAYRLMALLAIVWGSYVALKPHRLDALAVALAAVVGATLAASPIMLLAGFLGHPAAGERMHWPRVRLALPLAALALAAFLWLPVPHRVYVPAVLEPAAARTVYVSAPGQLTSAAAAGQRVEEGQTVARLANSQLALELIQLVGERDQLRLRLANLERRQVESHEAAMAIPTAREALADAEARLRQRREDEQRLTLTAGRAGTIFPARLRRASTAKGELPQWTGSPLDRENQGCYLETGSELCRIGDPGRWEAILLVDEDQVALVRAGQAVRLLVDQFPENTLEGTIVELARLDLQEAPPELIERGELAWRQDQADQGQPLRTYYQARVQLTTTDARLLAASTGLARISVAPQSLGARAWRFLAGTFRFEL